MVKLSNDGSNRRGNKVYNEFDLLMELNRMKRLSNNEYKFKILESAIINNRQKLKISGIVPILSTLNSVYSILFEIINEFNDRELKMFIDNMFDIYLKTLKKYRFITGDILSYFEKAYQEDIQGQIYKQWNNQGEGNKSFLDVFDDLHRNCLLKFPSIFVEKLGQLEYLFRAQRGKHFNNYERMLPIKSKNSNRWNPKGFAFMYLGYDTEIAKYDETISYIEKTCFEELRLKKGEDVTVCEFKPVKKEGKIINFCYEDIDYSDIESEQEFVLNQLAQQKVNQILSNPKTFSKLRQSSELYKDIVKTVGNVNGDVKTIIQNETEIYLGKLLMKSIDEAVFLPIDESEDPELSAYKPFHLLAKYLINEGYSGIIYRSTRMNLKGLKGKNLVLFNKDDVNYVDGTLKVYHCDEKNKFHLLQ